MTAAGIVLKNGEIRRGAGATYPIGASAIEEKPAGSATPQ